MKISISQIDPASAKAVLREFTVADGATVKEALDAAGIPSQEDSVGLWCKKVSLDTPLIEGDRIDVGCALRVDRQKARKLRAETAQKAPTKTLARHGGFHQLQKP